MDLIEIAMCSSAGRPSVIPKGMTLLRKFLVILVFLINAWLVRACFLIACKGLHSIYPECRGSEHLIGTSDQMFRSPALRVKLVQWLCTHHFLRVSVLMALDPVPT